MRTYKSGDTVIIEVEMRDPNGIGGVDGIFKGIDNDSRFSVYGNGMNQPVAKVPLSYEVRDETTPGVYALESLVAYGTLGNRLDVPSNQLPHIRVRIESSHEDLKPPEFLSGRLR